MFDISLIIPTYGRYEEVEKLLHSISNQTYALNKIEVILIDQNDRIDISPLVCKYQPLLNIIHKKTNIKGIANAKNTGIQLSSAPVITFPDDDCTYYKNTVESAINFLKENPDADIVYGRVYDRQKKMNIMRNWPLKNIKLNIYNFHLNYSAITCFTKRKDFLFDTRFGVGAYYALGEELDYIISALKQKCKIIYTHTIDVWHPQTNVSIMPLSKIYNYAKGYGAICKKQLNFPVFYLFFKSAINQILLIIGNGIILDKQQTVRHYLALKGRLKGFSEFRNQ